MNCISRIAACCLATCILASCQRNDPSQPVSHHKGEPQAATDLNPDELGKRIVAIKPESDRPEVERLIGPPPRKYFEDASKGMTNRFVGVYMCTPPGYEGNHMMTVHYELTNGAYKVTEVRGPHFPDGN